MKVAYSTLVADGDKPGLRVCVGCRDNLDPWRLPAPSPDKIELQYPRPDEAVSAPLINDPDTGGLAGT